MNYDRLREICCVATGLDASIRPDPPALDDGVIELACASLWGAGWADPRAEARALDAVLADLRSLRRRLERLNNYTCGMVQHVAPAMAEAAARFNAAIATGDDTQGAFEQLLEVWQQPRETWLVYSTLAQLRDMEAALVTVHDLAQKSASWRANGHARGRRPRRAPYEVARVAAKLYRELTGKEPTYWNEGETPFSRMLVALFDELEFDATNIRRPAEWAIGQNRPRP